MEKLSNKKAVVAKEVRELKGDHFDLARKTIESWPAWKKEAFNKVIRLTT